MNNDLVSIVVCTRNRGSSITGTLESIMRLPQEPKFHALIVDNASTDNTKELILDAVARDPRLSYIHVRKIGLGAGRDAAWRAATGDIVSFTDDDCYLSHDFVSQIVAVFAEYPDVGAVGGRILLHNPADARVTIEESTVPREYPAREFIAAGSLHGANLSFRKTALEQSGGFDPAFGAGTAFPAEDIDAVASVIWAGYAARYDPRPTVSHDHGRKDSDIDRLFVGYDAGRGAYWAKYFLRPDTRSIYMKHWWSITRKYRDRGMFIRTTREIRSATLYALSRRRFSSIALSAPAAAAVLSYVGARVIVRKTRSAVRALGKSH